MSEIRRLFDDIESLDQIYLKRRLVWFEKVSIMKQPDQGTVDYLEFLENMVYDKSMQETWNRKHGNQGFLS